MGFSYNINRRYLIRIFKFMLFDVLYGERIAFVIDPEAIPYSDIRICFEVYREAVRDSTTIDFDIIEIGITHRFTSVCDITEELYKRALKILYSDAKILEKEIIKKLLVNEIKDYEYGKALEKSSQYYRNKEFNNIQNVLLNVDKKLDYLNADNSGINSLDFNDRIKKLNNLRSTEVIPFGLLELDNRCGGGLNRGSLGCILAPAKRGKSMTLCHIAQTAILLKHNVMYITFEISDVKIASRIDGGIYGLEPKLINKRDPDTIRLLEYRHTALKEFGIGSYFAKSFSAKSVTILDLKRYIKDIEKEYGIQFDVIIVDYADDVKFSAENKKLGEQRYVSIGDVYVGLRDLASSRENIYGSSIGFDAAVWTASQVKPKAEYSELIFKNDAAESYMKANKVDWMLSFPQTQEEIAEDIFRIFNCCNRDEIAERTDFDEYGPFQKDFRLGRLIKEEDYRRFDHLELERILKWKKRNFKTLRCGLITKSYQKRLIW